MIHEAPAAGPPTRSGGFVLLALSWPGDPIPKGRPRHGRNGHAFTPARTRDAEDALRAAVNATAPPEPWAGPVRLDLVFHCRTRRRTDGDNLAKLVTDCLQRGKRTSGGVIVDDSQILDWHIRLYRGEPEPGTDILVRPLDT